MVVLPAQLPGIPTAHYVSPKCVLLCLAAGGSIDGAGEAGADEEAEPQEEAVPVARSARYNILWSKTAILHISTKNKDTGAYEWQNRGKGECSIRQDTHEPDKHYISFNLAGVSAQHRLQSAASL